MNRIVLTVCALLLGALPHNGFPASKGDVPPAFSLKDFATGESVSLEQFGGKIVYLDFWASWCGPCVKSFPFMNTLQADYGEQGLVVVTVNLDQKRADAIAFLDAHPATFIVLDGQPGKIAEQYGVTAMPSTYIIGRDGRLAAVHHGFKSSAESELRELIVDLL